MMTRLQTKRANLFVQSYDEVLCPTSELRILLDKCSSNTTKNIKIKCILDIYKIQNSHFEYFIKINELRKGRNTLYMVTYTCAFNRVSELNNYMNKIKCFTMLSLEMGSIMILL